MSYTFGNKLKEIRKKQKVTQQELADVINSTKATICRWENGSREPSIEIIKRMANYFNVSTDELLDYETFDYTFEYQHNDTKLIHKEKKK